MLSFALGLLFGDVEGAREPLDSIYPGLNVDRMLLRQSHYLSFRTPRSIFSALFSAVRSVFAALVLGSLVGLFFVAVTDRGF